MSSTKASSVSKNYFLVGIAVGTFFAGIGIGYVIFTYTYNPFAMTSQMPSQMMMGGNPQMMNQMMGYMMQSPQTRQQMFGNMMKNPEFMQEMMGNPQFQQNWMGPWMMNSSQYGQQTMGYSMMGGMMGSSGSSYWMMNMQKVQPLNGEGVEKASQDFVMYLNNTNLAVKDIMEFERNFYFIVYEKDTGLGAMEMIVWKDGVGPMSGIMQPEPGPNMMWNTKYGMMTQFQSSPNMTVSEGKAQPLAQEYLDANFPGSSAQDIDQFYGYYTIHIKKNGGVTGMLSVNGFSGQIWYHSWHGNFIREVRE